MTYWKMTCWKNGVQGLGDQVREHTRKQWTRMQRKDMLFQIKHYNVCDSACVWPQLGVHCTNHIVKPVPLN
jgi:hypothetical protein